MKRFKCTNCCYGNGVVLTPDSTVETDLYGIKKLVTRYYINCPHENDIDYILSNNDFKFLIAIADDSDLARDPISTDWYYTHVDNYIDCSRVKDYYAFDTIDEMLEFWKEKHESLKDSWYFMVHNKQGVLITFYSGVFNDSNIDIIKGYKALL